MGMRSVSNRPAALDAGFRKKIYDKVVTGGESKETASFLADRTLAVVRKLRSSTRKKAAL